MQSGLIIIWSGAIVDIPAGWVLCDGKGITPDLRSKFIIGAGDTYSVDDTGGTSVHNHPFTGDGHTHGFLAGMDLLDGFDLRDETASTAVTGTTDNGPNLPPYYALAFVMKT